MKHAGGRGSVQDRNLVLQEQYTNKQIALRLERSPSTISREINKGLDGNGVYFAWVAQVVYETNRTSCKQTPKLDHPAHHRLRSWIVACLQKDWDPSIISGRMKAEGFTAACAETIYAWIYTSV